MANIINIANYLLWLSTGSKNSINPLKLQKLLYYCEGWHLAISDSELFPGEEFQAWVHGPVNVAVYHEYCESYGMFDPINNPEDTILDDSVTDGQRLIIEKVFEVYNAFSGTQLEIMTHSESPWIEARAGAPLNMPSTAIISKLTMKREFAQRS